MSLDLKLEGLDEANDVIVNRLIKECDHSIAKYKKAKKDKIEFGVVQKQLAEDFSSLDKAHKALESELLSLTKSYEMLQTQLMNIPSSSNFIPSSSTTILEENARLKGELSKATFPQGNNSIDDLLSKQRPIGEKGGIGFVSKTKKKKSKPAQETNKDIVDSKTTSGKPMSHDDFAGSANPHYVLMRDYYGDVYAQYVGPYDGHIAWSIWVPKTLVANKRGPIEKWVPKK